MRQHQLNVRMDAAEMKRLVALAKHYGLSVASVVRMLVKRESDALASAAASRFTEAVDPILPASLPPRSRVR